MPKGNSADSPGPPALAMRTGDFARAGPPLSEFVVGPPGRLFPCGLDNRRYQPGDFVVFLRTPFCGWALTAFSMPKAEKIVPQPACLVDLDGCGDAEEDVHPRADPRRRGPRSRGPWFPLRVENRPPPWMRRA